MVAKISRRACMLNHIGILLDIHAHQFTVAAHMLRVCFKSEKPLKGGCLIVNCFSNCVDPFHGV